MNRCVFALVIVALLFGQGTRAQTRTASLGQPRRWHWQLGLGAGADFSGTSNNLMIRAVGGGYRASLNPVTKLAEFGVEGYVGVRGNRVDAGTRAFTISRWTICSGR